MTTSSPITRRLRILFGALLIAALLAAACSSNDAIDVTPAKPDDDTGAVAEPGGEDQPASSQPSDDADNNDSDEPGDPGTADAAAPDEAAPDEAAPGEPAPSSANGWTRLSPVADLLHVATIPGSQSIVVGGKGQGFFSLDGGATWTAVDWPGELRSEAYIDPQGTALVVAGFSPLSGMEIETLRSDDGDVWRDGPEAPAVAWFVLDSFLYAVPGQGVLASNDGGATGTLLGEASRAWPDSFDPFSIVISPRDLKTFAVTSVSEDGSAVVKLTRDGGTSFVQLAAEFELWGVTVPVFTGIGPLIMSQGVGMLFSFDQGATWFLQNRGLERLSLDGLFTGLVDFVSPPERSLPVVASRDSIFSFSPGGWEEMAGPGAEIRALGVRHAVPGGGEELLLAATDQGVWSIPTADLGAN